MSGKNLRVNLIANTSQFKSAMSESSNQIKLLNSEFRSAAAETDKYGNRLDATGAKKRQLNGVIEQYRYRIQAIKNEQKHWTRELEKGNITEEQHAQKQQELARRLNNTQAEMKRYEGQLKRLNAEGKATRMTFEQFDKQFREVGRTMRNVGAQVGITAGVGFMAMKRVLGDVVGEAKDFHAGMSEVQAISDATGSEMDKLTKQAKELGRQTIFTSKQASEAMSNMARAGFNVNEIYDSMPSLLDLAASSNLELGATADYTSNIIRTFGYEANQAGKVADVLAKGAATANTDVSGLAASMKTAGPVAKSLNIQFESVAAATGLMADSGIAGEQAGRMLRQGMLRLSKPTGEAAKLIKQMGIEVFDADGNMRSLDEVVGELQTGMKGYTGQQKAAALATIFGSESTAGWTVLLDQGSKALKDYTIDLENSEGAAKEMADTMQDNAEGAIIRMQSALSGLKIELGEKLLPILAKGADFVSDLANRLAELDEETIQTVAETALLVTAVLGVTTAVAGLAAGVGALMMFAGPVGIGIGLLTAGLTTLAGIIYKNSLETKNLAEEQEKASQEALRYGDSLSEGTLKGVKGYVDLYEGAKLEMHKLKTMSGEEAEKTKANVVDAFKQMGDEVVTELRKFAGEFEQVVNEIYGVYEDEGTKRAKEINNQVQIDIAEMIGNYESASKRIAEIIEEFGGNVSEYPPEVKKAYEANLEIMRQGAEVFATTYEDALAVRNRIAENKDKILFEESSKYVQEIEKTHREAQDNINKVYNEQRDVIEQFKTLYPENAAIYDEMMKTLESSTAESYLKIDKIREESLTHLFNYTDKHGRLIDLQTGKEFEREEVMDKAVGMYGMTMAMRAETDEEYYTRYVKTTEDYLKALTDTNNRSLDSIEKNAYNWAIQMGKTEKEAKQFAKDIRDGVLAELEQGDERAEKAGKDKGDAHKDGLDSTTEANKQAGKNITDGTDDELNKKKSDAEKAGKDKGTAHRDGLESTRGWNLTTSRMLSEGVTSELAKTTDGGGGKKAGSEFNVGLSSQEGIISSTAVRVAQSGETGLRSVKTVSAGNAFISGFANAITSGSGTGSSVWNAATNLGRSALSALKRAIDSHSPSRETEKEGVNFTDGFALAIKAGTGKVVNEVTGLATSSISTLSTNIKKQSDEVDFVTQRLVNRIKKVTNQSNKEIASINKKAKTEAKKLEQRSQEDINSIYRRAKNAKRKLTKAESVRIRRIEEDTATKIKKVYEKSAKDIEKVEKEKSKRLNDVRADEFAKSVQWIDYHKEQHNLSLIEELDAWERVQARYETGTKQREEADKNALRVKEEIHDTVMGLNDEYLGKIKQVNDEYEQALNQRTDSLRNFAGIFDEIEEKESVSGTQLIRNLKGQVDTLEDWSDNIRTLAERGIDKGLLKELQDMGPRASSEINALVKMSDEQLTEFEELWIEKTELAKEQALYELEELREKSEDKLRELQTEWIRKIESIRYGTRNELSKMPNDLNTIGKQAVNGMINGLEAMRGPLMAKARSLADAVIAEMQRAFDIGSPSKRADREVGRWIPAGVADGIERNTYQVENALLAMTDDSFNTLKTQMNRFKHNLAKLNFSLGENKSVFKVEHEVKTTSSDDILLEILKVLKADKTNNSNTQNDRTIINVTTKNDEEIAREIARAERRLAFKMG